MRIVHAGRVAAAVCAWALLIVVVSSLAQEPERESVRVEGVIEEIGPGVLQVADTQGTSWLVKVEARPLDLMYSGTAELGWLAPGMWVRCSTSLNQRLQSVEPVALLTVFTPQDPTQLGIFPQTTLGKDLFAAPEVETKSAKGQRAVDKETPCIVAGKLVAVRRNKCTVAAGNAVVTLDLAQDAKVSVEVADLRLASKGDKVTLEGWKYAMVPGRMVATRVSVSGAAPLGANTQGTRPPARSKAKGGEDAKPAGEPKPKP
jgi:hypothetical protein